MQQMKKIHSFDEVFDAQKVFRLVLNAMSNPTKIVNIKSYAEKLYGSEPEFLALAITLLDNEVSFYTCAYAELSDEIASLTLSKSEELETADFIFVSDPGRLKKVIEIAKCGTLIDPHKSATVIIKNTGVNTCQMILSGPGIKNNIEFDITETVKSAVELRDEQYYEYPQGIDFIFVSENGDLFAIPRLTRREAN